MAQLKELKQARFLCRERGERKAEAGGDGAKAGDPPEAGGAASPAVSHSGGTDAASAGQREP